MSGLILELQADALDHATRTSNLLRKALVISKKLGINEIENWIQKELNGYKGKDEIPAYRHIRGELKVWNPYHGWQTLNFGNAKQGEALSSSAIGQAVSELDELKENSRNGYLQVPFSQEIKNKLMQSMSIPLEPSLHVPYTAVIGILDSVRNDLLNWALELEKKGIVGEGMSFTKEEKTAATQVTYQITNNIGSMSHSQLQQHSNGSSQTTSKDFDLMALAQIIKNLRSLSSQLNLETSAQQEYDAELQTLEAQATSPKPKASILSESFKSIRTIIEGASGNLLASDLLQKISIFLQNIL